MTRYCIYCAGPLTRDRHDRVVHAQWWRRLMCLTPTPVRPTFQDADQEGEN
jgi:hypothetical protein